ncbi:MAG: hypothetical protein AAFY59_00295 [Pseudomonadota bacterium]
MTRNANWIFRAALATLTIWAGFIALRYSLPFWYDEVFTLGAAGINAAGPDWPVILRDVHPPTYLLLVNVAAQIVEGSSHAMRLVNALALPILGLAALSLRRSLQGPAFWAAILLLTGHLFFFHTSLELRSYGLLLALSTLGHALWLAHLQGRPNTPALLATALALTSLHFFGAALGTALLIAAGLHSRRPLPFAGAALCIAATLTWAFGIADLSGALGGGLWIRNGIGTWLTFASGLPLILTALLAVAVARKKSPERWPNPHPLWLLAPSAMVIAVALVISLHSPVISVKNLIVTIPGLALFTGMAAPPSLLKAANATPFTFALALLTTGASAWKAAQPHEYVRWAITTATPPNCDGIPLYVFRPDIVDEYAQHVFLGTQKRPLADIPDITGAADLAPYRGGCDIIAAGWHEPGYAIVMKRFFEQKGIPVFIGHHPQAEARGDTRLSPGFVIRLER